MSIARAKVGASMRPFPGVVHSAPERATGIHGGNITVFIVDDDALAHDALVALIGERHADVRVIHSPGSLQANRTDLGAHSRLPAHGSDTGDLHDRDDEPLPEDQRLTPRELEVIDLIGAGLSTKEISARLNLSSHTVKSHVRNVMVKLALHTRLQIAAHSHREHALHHQVAVTG
jgi:DNA-binding CsgD family transcriptional regulator